MSVKDRVRSLVGQVVLWTRRRSYYLLAGMVITGLIAMIVLGGVERRHDQERERERLATVAGWEIDPTTVPYGIGFGEAAVAARDARPALFTRGPGCRMWLRLPDGTMWSGPAYTELTIRGERMVRETDSRRGERNSQCPPKAEPARDRKADRRDWRAEDAARLAGAPFVSLLEGGCRATIRVPGGDDYTLSYRDTQRGSAVLLYERGIANWQLCGGDSRYGIGSTPR